MENRTKRWLMLYLFVILFFLSFIFAFPTVPVNFKLAGREISGTLSGPNINFQFFGKKIYKEVNLRLGLDLGGGTRFILRGKVEDIPENERDSLLANMRNIMEERMQFFNLTEPYIYTSKLENDYRVVLELAKEENAAVAAAIASQNAVVGIRELKEEFKESTDPNIMYDPNSYAEAAISSKDIIGSYIQNNPNTGSSIIKLRLTEDGKNKFSELAVKNAGGFITIFFDGSIIGFQGISPEVKAESAGEPVISGNFSSDQVKLLNRLINSGSLPFPVGIEKKEAITARFDKVIIEKVVYTIAAGILALIIFLVYRYKILGLLAGLSLCGYLIFLIAIFKIGAPAILLWIFTGEFGREILVPIRLTFAGILGVFLSVLITIMTNKVIFRNLKNKIKGADFAEVIDKNFKDSWKTIRGGSILILLFCIILGQFSIGQLKGFAITLSLGLLVGLFSAFVLMRTLVLLFCKREK